MRHRPGSVPGRRGRAGAPLTVARRGYMHAYANDAWGFYGNNDGTVRLTVTRV